MYQAGDGSLYRIPQSSNRSDPALADSFRSNYERNRPARYAETDWAIIHTGLSMYETAARAGKVARKFPRLGRFVAEARLTPATGICYAATGHPGHFTMWGWPNVLARQVATISPADQV